MIKYYNSIRTFITSSLSKSNQNQKEMILIKRRALIFILLIILLVVCANAFLFNPFNYPGALLNDYRFKWYSIKNPVSIQVRTDDEFFRPIVNDKTENKYMIKQFSLFEKIDMKVDYDYYQKIKDDGKFYEVEIRDYKKVISTNEELNLFNFSNGNIFITFKFQEKSNVAVMNGTVFYEMPVGFKEHILKKYSEVVITQ